METNNLNIKHFGSAKLFENRFLERMTRSHFSVPLILLSGIALSLVYYGNAIEGFSLRFIFFWSFIGCISWTLAEYAIHRFVFHMDQDKEIKRKITYTFHGIHHDYPKDKERLVMPPIGALLIGGIIFSVLYLLIGKYTFAFGPGFLFGYVLYALVHYAIHAYPPPQNFLKWLWINHSIHHYKKPDKAFGVTSPLWDYVFRTQA